MGMRISKAVIASLLISLLLVDFIQADEEMVNARGNTGRSLLQTIDCGGKCNVRCSQNSRPKICLRACGTCCARCNCVPPGTYGNYDVCPCYANMTTHNGRHKCP